MAGKPAGPLATPEGMAAKVYTALLSPQSPQSAFGCCRGRGGRRSRQGETFVFLCDVLFINMCIYCMKFNCI